jgi:hypothetical protein
MGLMVTRDELIEAGLYAVRPFGVGVDGLAVVIAVIDAVESKIRADERANPSAEVYARAYDEVSNEMWEKAKRFDGLRAQVKSLPTHDGLLFRHQVLALLES